MPKNEPTDIYFYLARHLVECMTRADYPNLHVYLVRTEMTATKQIPILTICFIDESELKEFLVNENLSQICSMEKYESKIIIVNKCSTGDNK